MSALNRPFRATSHRHDRLTQAVGLGYRWNAPLGLLFGIHDRLTQAVGLGYRWKAPFGLLFGIHDRITQAVGLGYRWNAPLGLLPGNLPCGPSSTPTGRFNPSPGHRPGFLGLGSGLGSRSAAHRQPQRGVSIPAQGIALGSRRPIASPNGAFQSQPRASPWVLKRRFKPCHNPSRVFTSTLSSVRNIANVSSPTVSASPSTPTWLR